MALPKRYCKVIRDLTGYWGAYPLSRPLEPGQIGRSAGGVFEHERHLRDLAGFDPAAHPVQDQATGNAYDRWGSDGVHSAALDAQAPNLAALPVGAGIKISFERHDSALISCHAARYRLFADLAVVRRFVLDSWVAGRWDPDWIVVTEVLAAESAAAAFATERGQSATFTVTGSLPLAGDLLSLVAEPSVELREASSWFGRVNGPCTPLFKAIRLRRSFLGQTRVDGVTKGPSAAFEEPEFAVQD